MARAIAGAVVALLVGGALIAVIQYGNYLAFPPSPELDPNDPADLERIMRSMPAGALAGLELSYVVGALVAGLVAWVVSRRAGVVWLVGGVLTALAVVNVMSVPHPAWLAALTLVTFVPSAWLGGRLGQRLAPSSPL